MKNMISLKKCLLLVLSVMMMVAISMAVAVQPAKADDATPVNISDVTFVMEEGAKTSFGENNNANKNGLKFAATLSKADYEGLMANPAYSDIEFGMLIVPSEYVAVYDLTEANLFGNDAVYDWAIYDGSEWVYTGTKTRIINIYAGAMAEMKDGNYCHEGTITKIKDGNIARDFIGRAYIKYTENDQVKYLMADYHDAQKANNTRSIAYVAQLTIDLLADDLEEGQVEWLQENYLDKTVVDVTDEDYAYVDLTESEDYVFAVDGTAIRVTTENFASVPFTAGANTVTLANALVKQGLAKGENVLYLHTRKVVDGNYVFGIKKVTVVAADMVLSTSEEFDAFIVSVRKATAATYADKYIVLANDVNGVGGHVDMVTSEAKGFAGTFDGRYHTVYGGTWGQAGMFAYVNASATVKNLNVVAPVIKWGYSGVIATHVAGTIENIKVVVNAALSTSTSTMTSMPETGLIAYGVKSTAVIKNCDIYRYDTPDAARNCSLWYSKAGTTVASYSGNDCYTQSAWTNKGAAVATDRGLEAVVISGSTEISTTAKDGAKVSLVNGLGVKVDAGVTVQNGKIVLDSANISAETFGTYTFFVEVENARGDIFIPVKLA